MLVFLAVTIFFLSEIFWVHFCGKNACEHKLNGQVSLLYGPHSCFSSYRTMPDINRNTSFPNIRYYGVVIVLYCVFQLQCGRPLRHNLNLSEKGGKDYVRDQIFATQLGSLVFIYDANCCFCPSRSFKCEMDQRANFQILHRRKLRNIQEYQTQHKLYRFR